MAATKGRRRWLQAGAAALCVLVVLLPPGRLRPAAAQTPPPDGGGGGLTAGCDPTAPTPPGGDGRDEDSGGDRACSTLMEKIVPGEEPGRHPTSHYDIGYDEGAWNHFSRKILGFLTETAFGIARWFVRVSLWIVSWALSFGFARRLADPAQAAADAYQSRVVEPLGLEYFFLTLAAAYGGWHALRGRMSRGGGEFFVSVTVAAVAATVLAYPGTFLLEALDRTSEVSFEVAAVTTAADPSRPADPDNVVAPIAADIHRAFVETPHQLIDWGRTIPEGDPCRGVYDEIVATGPWGSKDEPRDAMKAAGCEEEAKFNHDPSPDRLGAAALVALGTVFVAVMMVLIAVALVGAQIGVVVAIAVSPFGLVSGVLPGGGRQLMWRWVAGWAKCLAAVVMTAVFLSLFLVGLSALLAETSGEALVVQMLVVDIVVIVALVKRKKLMVAGRRAVTNVTQRLENAKVGGSGRSTWLGPAAAGAAVGFGADEVLDKMRYWHRDMGGTLARHRAAKAHRAIVRDQPGRPSWSSYGPGAAANGAATAAAAAASAASGPAGDGHSPRTARALQARLQHSRGGRVAMGTGKVATKATKLAFASTVGAPVYLPRAARATTAKYDEVKERLGEATERVTGQGREFAREYRQGLGAPVRGARRVWGGTKNFAAEARTGVTVMTQQRGASPPAGRRPGPSAATTEPRPARNGTGRPPAGAPRPSGTGRGATGANGGEAGRPGSPRRQRPKPPPPPKPPPRRRR